MVTNKKYKVVSLVAAVLGLIAIVVVGIFFLTKNKNTKSSEIEVSPISAGSKIKVSVIVPVYKTEKYLDECVQSILNQTLKEFEAIFVDDGSPDNCGKILDGYAKKDERVKVIHQENAGVSAARNRGIEKARGEYLHFVDSDDTIAKDTLKVCYAKAKKQDADILLYEQSRNGTLKKPVFKKLTSSSCMGIYRRSLIDRECLRFKTDLKYAEDQVFNLMSFPEANKILTTTDRFYNYRNNPDSACHTSKKEIHSKSHAAAAGYIYKHWKKKGYFKSNEVKREFLHWVLENNYWGTKEINKMFIKSIGPELLTDGVLNLLSKDDKNRLKKMILDSKV